MMMNNLKHQKVKLNGYFDKDEQETYIQFDYDKGWTVDTTVPSHIKFLIENNVEFAGYFRYTFNEEGKIIGLYSLVENPAILRGFLTKEKQLKVKGNNYKDLAR
jgi:hypothetical protein